MAVSKETIEILIKARDEASAKLNKLKQSIKKNGEFTKAYQGRLDTLSKAQTRLQKSQALTRKSMNKVKTSFDGAALSIMFFGMAMSRVSTQIWTAGTKTFQDVMHSVDGTVTSFDMLNAAGDTLKFTLGAALEPIAAQLVPIVLLFGDWLSEHEALVRGIVISFGAAGAVMTAFGIIKLGLTSLSEKFVVVWNSAKSLYNKDWSAWGTGLSSKINKAVGVIGIMWAFQSAGEAYKDFESGEIANGVLKALQTGAFAGAFIAKKGKGALFAIGVALELVEKDVLFTTLNTSVGLIASVFITLGEQIRHSLTTNITGAFVDAAFEIANTLSGGTLKLLGLGKAKNELKELAGFSNQEFDFAERYKQNVADFRKVGMQWDKSISNFKESVDKIAEYDMYQSEYGITEDSGVYSAQVDNKGGTVVNVYSNSEDGIISAINRVASNQGILGN